MRFAKWVFLTAGSYGLAVIVPMYFSEARIGIDDPPAITHPEYFYGFLGVTIAWQIVFLIVGREPSRYRIIMLPAIVEKASYGLASLVLFSQHRVSGLIAIAGSIDLILGGLFVAAYWVTRNASPRHDFPNEVPR